MLSVANVGNKIVIQSFFEFFLHQKVKILTNQNFFPNKILTKVFQRILMSNRQE